MANQKGLIQLILGVLVLIFISIILGIGIYLYRSQSNLSTEQTMVPSSNIVSKSDVNTEITQSMVSGELGNWKTYTSEQCKISFDYPADLQIITSFDHPEFGCRASFGIPNESSKVLVFGTPIGMTKEELVVRYPDNQRIVVDGSDGYVEPNPQGFDRAVNFFRGSIAFQLLLVSTNENEEIDSIFDHIVRSVRFRGSDSDYNQTFKTIIPLEEE